MAREDLHFRLRIPEELKREVEASAEQSNRSMTAEILERVAGYPALREFWATADAKIARLEGLVGDAQERRNQIRALEDEVQRLRLALAREQGVSASMQRGVKIFTEHLLKASEGTPVSLEAIMEDIKASPPTRSPDVDS